MPAVLHPTHPAHPGAAVLSGTRRPSAPRPARNPWERSIAAAADDGLVTPWPRSARWLGGALLVLGASMLVAGSWMAVVARDMFPLMAGLLALLGGMELWQGRREGGWIVMAMVAVGLIGAFSHPMLDLRHATANVDVLLLAGVWMAALWPAVDARVPRALGMALVAGLAALLLWAWTAPPAFVLPPGPPVPAVPVLPQAAPAAAPDGEPLPAPYPAPDVQAAVTPIDPQVSA